MDALPLLLSAAFAVQAMEDSATSPAPAAFVVTEEVLRPAEQVPPIGANGYGRCGAIEWAANNFVQNSGNEPIWWRNLHRVTECGERWFEIDGGGVSWWDLWGNGFLSGARVRVYRIVDENGVAIAGERYLEMERAHHVELVGETTVLPAGTPGLPEGGWVVTEYGDVHRGQWIRGGNLSVTDARGLENGVTYWYTLIAVDAEGRESAPCDEVAATPRAGLDTPPHILIGNAEDRFPPTTANQGFRFELEAVGGTPPYKWSVVEGALPAGLELDPASGVIEGIATDEPILSDTLRIAVTDADGRRDSRVWHLLRAVGGTGDEVPRPPSRLTASAGDGFVTLRWKPSPSQNSVAYRLKRSTRPLANQENRVYLAADAPPLERFDYVVIEKKFDPFDMRLVHPRVRGIGNPVDAPNWYWRHEPERVRLSLEAHQDPPAEMIEPGETCLRIDALDDEEAKIEQFVFIGTDLPNDEPIWYGQLEPGKPYRMEVWLRREKLGAGGAVTFSYGRAYPGLEERFEVTGDWQRFTHDFVGPERPGEHWHFGHRFAFTGPGTLWLDNARIFRVEGEPDAPFVPNATVLEERLTAAPASGPKGAQRCWVLDRHATMASLLSWHGSSQVSPDWSTSVRGTVEMTIPMALELCARTGDGAEERVTPWFVLQHMLHDEADWRALVEYLAVPFDPERDSAEAKPWAHRRFTQRGAGTPWTDEFDELIIEFGNETWHNGVFDDWIGFHLRNNVWQGGPEYGLFCQYLIEGMRSDPRWAELGLDGKIRFALGDGYPRRDVGDGWRLTYGEEAMRTCPDADLLAHANYIGPKWETGDASASRVDDHGVQLALLAYPTGNAPEFVEMRKTRERLAAAGVEYELAAYESGPSGYALPGRAGKAEVLVQERYGKSLAMAVAALDGWLGAYAEGWTHQCFFSYGQGRRWNSHTWFSEGFRPSPAWEAMKLRNRHARGDLVTVEAVSSPTIEIRGESHPLIGCYAFREERRWSVFLLSRKLDGEHDGVDFGDGATRVALTMPPRAAERITLYRLTGDPRENNLEERRIAIESIPVPAKALHDGRFEVSSETGGLENGLPPGSVYLYVFETN